jgi:hypothetical protein
MNYLLVYFIQVFILHYGGFKVLESSLAASSSILSCWLQSPCMSWYFDDSSHRDGLSEGLVREQRRVRLEIRKWRHSTYPGSGPSSPEVKPLCPALVFIISTRWLTVLLDLCCLEEEEEVFDLPILRVQAPLYRQGPGYKTSSSCPATGFSVAAALAQVIRLKCIYNFLCSMRVYTPFALCFVTLCGVFMHFPRLTY